jgi:hypothetical protein
MTTIQAERLLALTIVAGFMAVIFLPFYTL